MKKIEKVKEFMTTFGQEVKNKIELPSRDIMALRVSLLVEEVMELQAAFAANDLVEVNDAFQDIQYVLDGAILSCGMESINDKAFDEVHRSNMSKACKNMEEVEATIKFYKEKNGTEAGYKQIGDVYVVYRLSDNKTLKSINYSPAALAYIVKKQMKEELLETQAQALFIKATTPLDESGISIMSIEEAEKQFKPFQVKK